MSNYTEYRVINLTIKHISIIKLLFLTKSVEEELNRYTGLKVGSVDEPNNNAGNWE